MTSATESASMSGGACASTPNKCLCFPT
jgi:hypothetical protein